MSARAAALFAFVRSAGFTVRDTGAVQLATDPVTGGARVVFLSVRDNGDHVIMTQSSRGSSYQRFRSGRVSARAKLLAALVLA